MRTVDAGIVTSIIRKALYDEGLGGDLGRGQRGWLVHRPGHEPGASLTLLNSLSESVEGLCFSKRCRNYRVCNEGAGVTFQPPECPGQMKTRILMWAIKVSKHC